MELMKLHDIMQQDNDIDDDDDDNDSDEDEEDDDDNFITDCPFGCQCFRRVVQCSDLGKSPHHRSVDPFKHLVKMINHVAFIVNRSDFSTAWISSRYHHDRPSEQRHH